TETPTETLTPIAETVTPTPTSTVVETLGSTLTATPFPPTAETPALSLSADPTFITPGGNLLIQWMIGGVTLQGQSLVLKITLPDGFVIQDGSGGVFDEATRILTIPVTVLSGEVHLNTSQSAGDVTLRAFLLKGSETLATAELPL